MSLLLKVEHISYTMGTSALPDIYTLRYLPMVFDLPNTILCALSTSKIIIVKLVVKLMMA